MAIKAKQKPRAMKKTARRSAVSTKSIRLKAKAVHRPARKPVKSAPKGSARRGSKPAAKVESRRKSVGTAVAPVRSTTPNRIQSKRFANAVHAYEIGLKLMHSEEFEKARKCFLNLIAEHTEEPEIQERAKVLIHVCEKKIQEKARTVLRTADDHYNVGIADLNRRAIDSAIQHLQHALKLAPKADHILYALAVANALHGNRDQALTYLKQSIHHRPENRFLAVRDNDFETLQEDENFKQLVTYPEK